jgi:hypothetical protein
MAEVPTGAFPVGSLFLGAKLDPATHKRTEEQVIYEAANLTTHGVIVGMTGSGKTGLGIVLLEEALLQGIPVLVIDPKGDMGNLMLTFPELDGPQFRPYINESEAQRAGVSPDDLAATTATNWREGLASWGIDGARVQRLKDAADVTIYTPGSTMGVPLNIVGDLHAPGGSTDAEMMQDEIDGLVSSLLNLVGIESDPLSGREHILLTNLVAAAWTNSRSLDLPTLVQQVQDPPVRKLGVIDIDTFFPPKDRTTLALKLNGLLASPAFAAWAQGAPLDIASMLYNADGKAQAAIIELAHLSDEERQFVVTLVLSKVVTWFRQQAGTPDLRALIYMDEVFGFVPPSANPPAKKPILTILKQARAFGVGMVLATQNPVDMDYKAMSNAGTWMIGRLQTERDKARLLEGLTDAAGATDIGKVGDTLSGLSKREFLFHSTRSNTPFTFSSRWAMSFLPGPLSRDQIATLTRDNPRRAVAAPAAAAASLTMGASTAGAGAATAPPSVAAANAPMLGDDESAVAPAVADGIRTYYLDPAAPWASEYGVSSTGRRLQAAVFARCSLLFDDDKADLREEQEWEAVFFPLNGPLDPGQAKTVDYDDRDLRDAAAPGTVFVLPDADIKNKMWWSKAKTELVDWLYRNQSIEVMRNADLKLYSRPGESRQDFVTRCNAAADVATDAEADKLRQTLLARSERIKDSIAKAEDKVREVNSDRSRRGLDAVVSVAGGILGSLLGGKKSTKGILSTIGRATSKGGMTNAANERLNTAKNRLDEGQQELADIESDLADKLRAIADEWDAKAAAIDTVEIPLEKTDIGVSQLVLVWLATD